MNEKWVCHLWWIYLFGKSTEQSLEICPEANAGEIKHNQDNATLSGWDTEA